jgi:hypothetical protein
MTLSANGRERKPGRRSCLRRVPLLPLIRWPVQQRRCRTFPFAVTRNRFCSPLCVFILGIEHHPLNRGRRGDEPHNICVAHRQGKDAAVSAGCSAGRAYSSDPPVSGGATGSSAAAATGFGGVCWAGLAGFFVACCAGIRIMVIRRPSIRGSRSGLAMSARC